MAGSNGQGAGVVQPKLALVGARMNTMAPIAPGAFLWIMYSASGGGDPERRRSGQTTCGWGSFLRRSFAFLLPSHARSRKDLPGSGFCRCAYFAEKAWLDAKGQKRIGPTSAARISKLVTGWSAHLFYWAYSGFMDGKEKHRSGLRRCPSKGNTVRTMAVLVRHLSLRIAARSVPRGSFKSSHSRSLFLPPFHAPVRNLRKLFFAMSL